MNEVFRVAKFKLHISNRKKNVLKNIMLKYTNSFADVLEKIQRIKDELEFESLQIRISKKGIENYSVNTNKLRQLVAEFINNTEYKSYRFREKLADEISNNLASYFGLRLKNENPSYPSITNLSDKKITDDKLKNLYKELIYCGIGDEGIDKQAHEKETELAGEISRLTKVKYLPISFLRYRDFRIIESTEHDKTPVKIALLNLFTKNSGEEHFRKLNLAKPIYKGKDIYDGNDFLLKSSTILPCILEWSKYHELNYFKLGTPKTAKIIYDNLKNDFYLHITFQFLPHVDENGKHHFVKKTFDAELTKLSEQNISSNSKNKIYNCFDAVTGEVINIKAKNKTVENKARETNSFMGVDLGRIMLAAYAVVSNGKLLYRDFAESTSVSKKLYNIYERIGELQKLGKQNKKELRLLYKKLSEITKNSVHQTANNVVWARNYYNSQLVFENLKGLRRLPKKKVQQYSRLTELVSYKSQLKGFGLNLFNPPAAYFEVFPSQTSKQCSKCGYTHELNRRIEISQKDFKCMACGYEDNADLNAAINIARLGEYNYKFKGTFDSFDNYLITLADCKNSNFDSYRNEKKKRTEVYKVSKLIDNRIKLQKKKKELTLV